MLKFIYRKKRNPNRNRRGVASLEFVMCLPFIVLITAIIFRIGIAALTKAKVAVDVRREVWQARDQFDSSKSALAKLEKDETTALAITSFLDPTDGKLLGEASQGVINYQWLGGNKTAMSRTAIVAGTWDYRQLGILDDGLPHIEFIPQILGAGGVADKVSTIKDKLGWLWSLLFGDGFPFSEEDQEAIDEADGDVSDAQDEYNEKRKELEDKLAEERLRLQALIEERQVHIDNKAALELEQSQKRTHLQQLLNQADGQDPVDPALQQQIDDTRDRLSEISSEITHANNEIDRLNEEIDQAEENIQRMEDGLAELDEMMNGD